MVIIQGSRWIFRLLRYSFILRALVAGSFIALLCAGLGVILVLKRLSLIGDGLAHVTFGSVALRTCAPGASPSTYPCRSSP